LGLAAVPQQRAQLLTEPRKKEQPSTIDAS
jgi:hypothetical protein